MGQVVNNQLKERIWGKMESPIDGLERCLSAMTEEQLTSVLRSYQESTCERCGCEHDSICDSYKEDIEMTKEENIAGYLFERFREGLSEEEANEAGRYILALIKGT